MLKGIVEKIIISLISTTLIQIILSNLFWTAIFAFITAVFLSLMAVIDGVFKINKDIKKLHFIFSIFYLILIFGIILIIINVPYSIKVPDFRGWPIVPASIQAENGGFDPNPIRIETNDEIVTFQDPLKGSSVVKNSALKLVAGKPTIKITSPIENSGINSSFYITGNSSGVENNYPKLLIYILLYNYSSYQVQEVSLPKPNGMWQTTCNCKNFLGKPFSIYAIITTREIKEDQIYDKFPNPDYVLASDSISLRI